MKSVLVCFAALFCGVLAGCGSGGSTGESTAAGTGESTVGSTAAATGSTAASPTGSTAESTLTARETESSYDAGTFTAETTVSAQAQLDRDGSYTTKDDVALYIHLYGELPANFITKEQAGELGWEGGSLEPYAPGKCIGGSRFGNYEGSLPKREGRTYRECDIDTLGASSRGAKRLVYSDDGLIYYTADHYKTFELLYGEEN